MHRADASWSIPRPGFLEDSSTLRTKTNRDADYWGAQAELKFGRAEPVHDKPNIYRNDYFIVGADVRGIDQDNRLRGRELNGFDVFTYNETPRYHLCRRLCRDRRRIQFRLHPVCRLAVKGVGGIYDRLGLRTFINLRAGLYNADTDYDGRFSVQLRAIQSKFRQSNDELAFIGTVSLETRKQIGMRTSLSLVDRLRVHLLGSGDALLTTDRDEPTQIDDDGVFASRTMLRLNIGLGPAALYPPPP